MRRRVECGVRSGGCGVPNAAFEAGGGAGEVSRYWGSAFINFGPTSSYKVLLGPTVDGGGGGSAFAGSFGVTSPASLGAVAGRVGARCAWSVNREAQQGKSFMRFFRFVIWSARGLSARALLRQGHYGAQASTNGRSVKVAGELAGEWLEGEEVEA